MRQIDQDELERLAALVCRSGFEPGTIVEVLLGMVDQFAAIVDGTARDAHGDVNGWPYLTLALTRRRDGQQLVLTVGASWEPGRSTLHSRFRSPP